MRPVSAARLDPRTPAALDGLVNADRDRPARREGRDQQAGQATRHRPARPAAAVEHAVVVGEAGRSAQAHAAQRRGNHAPARAQDGACDEHQQVGPGRAGARSRRTAPSTQQGGRGEFQGRLALPWRPRGVVVAAGQLRTRQKDQPCRPAIPCGRASRRSIRRAAAASPCTRQGAATQLPASTPARRWPGSGHRGRRHGAGALAEWPALGRSRTVRDPDHAARRSPRLYRFRAALLDQRMTGNGRSRAKFSFGCWPGGWLTPGSACPRAG